MPFEAPASRLRVSSRARREIKYDTLVDEASNFDYDTLVEERTCVSDALFPH